MQSSRGAGGVAFVCESLWVGEESLNVPMTIDWFRRIAFGIQCASASLPLPKVASCTPACRKRRVRMVREPCFRIWLTFPATARGQPDGPSILIYCTPPGVSWPPKIQQQGLSCAMWRPESQEESHAVEGNFRSKRLRIALWGALVGFPAAWEGGGRSRRG